MPLLLGVVDSTKLRAGLRRGSHRFMRSYNQPCSMPHTGTSETAGGLKTHFMPDLRRSRLWTYNCFTRGNVTQVLDYRTS